MSEQESKRLWWAVNHLMDALDDASETARRGLDFRRGVEDEEEFSLANPQLEGALTDVLDILEGAKEDVHGILGDGV